MVPRLASPIPRSQMSLADAGTADAGANPRKNPNLAQRFYGSLRLISRYLGLDLAANKKKANP